MLGFAILSGPIALGLAFVPHFVKSAVLLRNKAYDNKKPRTGKSVSEDVDAFAERCKGAHNNQLETLGPYAAGVAVAVAVGVPSKKLNTIAATFIGSRIAYNVAYMSPQVLQGIPRTLSWMGAMGSIFTAWLAAFAKARGNDAEAK